MLEQVIATGMDRPQTFEGHLADVLHSHLHDVITTLLSRSQNVY